MEGWRWKEGEREGGRVREGGMSNSAWGTQGCGARREGCGAAV